MPTARKLPSGSYMCRVWDKNLKKQICFTDKKKAEAERKAALYQIQLDALERSDLTFEQAAGQFFQNRTKAFSEGTTREYKRTYEKYLAPLYPYKVDAITNEELQALANTLAVDRAPKTVKNIYGLAVSIIHSVLPGKRFSIRISRKAPKKEVELPSKEDIEKLLSCKKSDDMQLAIELALYGGLRRGEICALEVSDLTDNTIHIQRAMVQDEYGLWVIKAPKTAQSDRFVELPPALADKIRARSGKAVNLTPNSVTNDFPKIAKRAGVKVTFHQLRHWSASYLHDNGVSEAEILKRFGWSQGYVFKNVYRHAFNMDKSTKVMADLFENH
jgi:integrase